MFGGWKTRFAEDRSLITLHRAARRRGEVRLIRRPPAASLDTRSRSLTPVTAAAAGPSVQPVQFRGQKTNSGSDAGTERVYPDVRLKSYHNKLSAV